ncbi:MAG: pilus assembly protein N-terminal domain-containing protein [Rubripirellula sp.]
MREKRKRRFCTERRRAAMLAVILCTSTALADHTELKPEVSDSVQKSAIVQRVEPLEIRQGADLVEQPNEARTLQHPPLPLLSSQQQNERVHPFLESSQPSESDVRLTSGLADFIRGASAQEQSQEVRNGDQKVKLVTPSDLSAPVVRVEVAPTPARRLAEPSFARNPQLANDTDEFSFADRVRGEEQSVGNSSHAAPEEIIGLVVDTPDLDSSATSELETQPTTQRKSTKLRASLVSTPISANSPASLVGASPKIQKVLPLPASSEEPSEVATPDESPHQAKQEPILFFLTDQPSPSEVDESPSSEASPASDGITFSLSDRLQQNSAVAGSPSKHEQPTSVLAVAPPTAETPVEGSERIEQQPLGAGPGLTASPVILQRPVITLTQVPKISSTISSTENTKASASTATGLLELPSPIADSNIEEPAAMVSAEGKEAGHNGAVGEEHLLAEAAVNDRPNAGLEPKEPIVAEVHEEERDSTPVADTASDSNPNFDNAVALATPVPEITLPETQAESAEISESQDKQNSAASIADQPVPTESVSPAIEHPIIPAERHQLSAGLELERPHSKTRDAIVGLPQPWSLSWLLANQEVKILDPAPTEATDREPQPGDNQDSSPSTDAADQDPLVVANLSEVQTPHQDSATINGEEENVEDWNAADQPKLVEAAVSDANPQALPEPLDAPVKKPNSLIRPKHLEYPQVTRSPVLSAPKASESRDQSPRQLPMPVTTTDQLVEKPSTHDPQATAATHRVAPVAISAVPVKLQNRGLATSENLDRQIQISPAMTVGVDSDNTVPNTDSLSDSYRSEPRPFAPQVKRVPLYMKRAQVRSLTVAGELQDVRVVDTSICQVVVVGPNRIKLIAARSGITELMVWAKTEAQDQPVRMRIFKVHVENVDPSVASGGRTTQMLHAAIRSAFPHSNIDISHQGAELIVSGRCRSQEDAEKIIRMVRSTCLVTVQDRLTVD